MSRVRLGNINISTSVDRPDFYVASIVDSESGFTSPRMISDSNDIDAFYGKFPYSSMYKRLIESGVPVVLTPVLTKVSEYNRSSLRINSEGSIVEHCHPRYGKEYDYTTFGDIQTIQISHPVDYLKIRTRSKFHLPYVFAGSDGSDLSECITSAKYSFGKDGYSVIELTMSHKVTGYITIECYPDVDSNPNLAFTKTLVDKVTFTVESDAIPEIVLLDSNGYSVGYDVTAIDNGINLEVTIDVDNLSSGQLTAYIRSMPNEYMAVRSIVAERTDILHDLGYYPLIKPQQLTDNVLHPFVASVQYDGVNNCILTVSDVESGMTIHYNISETDSTIDVDSISVGETVFNQVLDFSKVTDEDIVNSTDILYFIILINGTRYLFIRPYGDRYVSSDYYDVRVPLLVTESDGSQRLVNTVNETIEVIENYLDDRIGSQNVLTYREEVLLCVERAFDKLGKPGENYDFYQWEEEFRNFIYSNELFLGSYRNLINIFDQVIEDKGELIQESDLVNAINSSDLFNKNKLLIQSYIPTQSLNHYEFRNLDIYDSFNSTQDSLCELSERDKLIEFYSKIKGPIGENLQVTIEKQLRYKSYYRIEITMGDRYEEFYCYTYKSTEDFDILPSDAIDIRRISQLSQLVEVKLYDYVLPTGRIIDQTDFTNYYQNSEFDNKSVKLVDLPSGTWHLMRYQQEDWIYSDYQDTLELLASYNYYPDLFLVTQLVDGYKSQHLADVFSYVRGDEPNSYGGIIQSGTYSQALVTVRWDDFQNASTSEFFISQANRMLYFYDDITIDDEKYPTFYPYVSHILDSDMLRIPSQDLIADYNSIVVGNAVSIQGQPYLITDVSDDGLTAKVSTADGYEELMDISEFESIELLLDECRINYLKFSNLYYYYLNLYEKVGQPTLFVVKFAQSKLSRRYITNRGRIATATPFGRSQILSSIVNEVKLILPYVQSISYTTTENNRTLSIEASMTMKGLVNRVFRINYDISLT